MRSNFEQEVKQDYALGERVKYHQNILKELGIQLNPDSKILDFGCGAGETVYHYRKQNFQACGVDIKDYYRDVEETCYQEKFINPTTQIFQTIDTNKYRIPFEDNTFDFVFSEQVLEHVQNLSEALEEIKRILKNGGYSIHFFPPKYSLIEGHVYVPFAGIFQGYYYLLFWSFLGIRNEYQKGLNFKKVADINFEYLKTSTNYPSPGEVQKYFSNCFKDIVFIDKLLIEHHPKAPHYLKLITKIFPFIPFLVRTFYTRAIFVRKA